MGQVQVKAAYVTGGASGIGAACAMTLAREGAKVMLTDLDVARGEKVAADITAAGGTAVFRHQDVTDEAAWEGLVSEAESLFGRLDIMVANAGIAIFGPASTMSLAEFRRQNAVNIDGVFLSARTAIAPMRRAGGGSMILISSVAGLRGSANLAGYSASKGAVRMLAKSLALELALDGIRVNSVHPGIIITPIWEKAASPLGGGLNAPLDPYVLGAAVPIGKPSSPQEIANGVLFLASDASHHMTGAEFVIDGGITAGAVRRPS